jgi:hypothetical protein
MTCSVFFLLSLFSTNNLVFTKVSLVMHVSTFCQHFLCGASKETMINLHTKRINTSQLKKSLKIPKGQSESVYQKVTDNTMAKRKSTKGQTKIYTTIDKHNNRQTLLFDIRILTDPFVSSNSS